MAEIMPWSTILPIMSAVVSRLSGYLVLIAAARLLDPDGFGIFSVIATVAAVVNAVVSGGGDMWLSRFTWRHRARVARAPRLWHVYLAIVAALAILALGAAAGATFAIEPLREYRAEIMLATGGAVAAGLAEALLAIVRASGMTRLFFGLRDLAAPLAILIAIVALRPHEAGGIFAVFLAVWSTVLVALAAILALYGRSLLPEPRWRRDLWRSVSLHTLGLVYGNIGSRLAMYADILVLAQLISLSEIGEYRIAAQFAMGFVVVQHFVFLALPWQLRHIGSAIHPGAGHALVVWRQRALLGLAAASAVVLSLLAVPLLSLFGERFTDIAPVFRILVFMRFASLLWGPQHEILVSNGHVLSDAHSNFAALGAWLVGFAALENRLGAIAAALAANAVALLVGQTVRHRLIERNELRHGDGHGFGPMLPAAGALAAMTAAAVLL